MLPAETLVVDGVVAPLTADGKKLGYFLFDLPYLDGHDLARSAARAPQGACSPSSFAARPSRGPSATSSTSRATARRSTARPAASGAGEMVSRRADSRYGARAGWVRVALAARPASRATLLRSLDLVAVDDVDARGVGAAVLGGEAQAAGQPLEGARRRAP